MSVLSGIGILFCLSLSTLRANDVVLPGTTVNPVIQTGVPHPTQDKPQSKLWYAHGHWWAWLPAVDGSTIWQRRDDGWKAVESLNDSLKELPRQADVWSEGNQVRAVLAGRNQLAVAALEYDAAQESYKFQSAPVHWKFAPVEKSTLATETATISRDGRGRFWVAWDRDAKIWARASLDETGTTWTEPIEISEQAADTDDLCTLIAIRGQMGLLWSDQKNDTVWFRGHRDEDSPETWQPIEIVDQGGRTVDDHLNAKVATDGTLYVTTKNSVDHIGQPQLVLRIRRTDGSWENVPYANRAPQFEPSRPILLLGGVPERMFLLHTVYSARSTGLASFIEVLSSPLSRLDVHREFNRLLVAESPLNNVTGCKHPFPEEAPWIVLASDQKGNVYEAVLPDISNALK
ncbi:MAG TPA: hypothetical protein VNQ76_06850 [Planctomicrobium sp.]|nr:hypothetical protein [Planctomicrobium sp.]